MAPCTHVYTLELNLINNLHLMKSYPYIHKYAPCPITPYINHLNFPDLLGIRLDAPFGVALRV